MNWEEGHGHTDVVQMDVGRCGRRHRQSGVPRGFEAGEASTRSLVLLGCGLAGRETSYTRRMPMALRVASERRA